MSRKEQKRQTRERVLATARDCFIAQGYEATTIAVVARRAQVATGTVMAHFADKPTLVAAAFHRELAECIERGFATLPKGPVVDQLLHVAGVLYGWYADHPDLGRALVRETLFRSGVSDSEMGEQLDDFVGRVAALLVAAQQRGEAPGVPVELVSIGFFSDYFGVLVAGLSGRLPSVSAQLGALRGLTELRLGALPSVANSNV
ncbi:MAG: TetR/AcrR family transcriptional regulator [Proteobacteria bacterium]|nr:TetR/AcrR family transcriptional regulator [Pseudomonadota bacterium]